MRSVFHVSVFDFWSMLVVFCGSYVWGDSVDGAWMYCALMCDFHVGRCFHGAVLGCFFRWNACLAFSACDFCSRSTLAVVCGSYFFGKIQWTAVGTILLPLCYFHVGRCCHGAIFRCFFIGIRAWHFLLVIFVLRLKIQEPELLDKEMEGLASETDTDPEGWLLWISPCA